MLSVSTCAPTSWELLLNGGGGSSGGGGGGGGGGVGMGGPELGGASAALYERFLAPILCALMFAPPEELSAAAAMDVLYAYVLAHQDDFDVRSVTHCHVNLPCRSTIPPQFGHFASHDTTRCGHFL